MSDEAPAACAVKLCKDCRYFQAVTLTCRHEVATLSGPLDYVLGFIHDPSRYQAQCRSMRMTVAGCGPDAKLFEPGTP